ASGAIEVVDAIKTVKQVLYRFPGITPRPVATTIDARLQAEAQQSLAAVGQRAALVALDVETGQVEAAVSTPVGGFPRALRGRYPPGSTFKIVTTAAALGAGLDLQSPLECPASVTVEGKTFTNAEHEQLGTLPLVLAFARSCNTAYVKLAGRLTDAQLEAAAQNLGVGLRFGLPIRTFSGSMPAPVDAVEHAADAIGQGRVLVSPLEMASMVAAVARDGWQPPRLLVQEAPGALRPLGPGVAAELRQAMRAVVVEGTGTAANLSGPPVYGKTGTAEFGSDSPPKTHAWFVGVRGNLAFAVVVEGGGFGGDVAAPIAA